MQFALETISYVRDGLIRTNLSPIQTRLYVFRHFRKHCEKLLLASSCPTVWNNSAPTGRISLAHARRMLEKHGYTHVRASTHPRARACTQIYNTYFFPRQQHFFLIIVYLISVQFTMSEAIQRLALGYYGIGSPIYTYKLHIFYNNDDSRTRLNVTSYVHCLSCLECFQP